MTSSLSPSAAPSMEFDQGYYEEAAREARIEEGREELSLEEQDQRARKALSGSGSVPLREEKGDQTAGKEEKQLRSQVVEAVERQRQQFGSVLSDKRVLKDNVGHTPNFTPYEQVLDKIRDEQKHREASKESHSNKNAEQQQQKPARRRLATAARTIEIIDEPQQETSEPSGGTQSIPAQKGGHHGNQSHLFSGNTCQDSYGRPLPPGWVRHFHEAS